MDKQQEFISWLSDKLGAKDDNDLKKKLESLGDQGVKQAYDQFMAESNNVQSNKEGGKLEYLKCLQAFKHGGAIEASKCGCDKDSVQTAKFGARIESNTKENGIKKDWMSKGPAKMAHQDGSRKEAATKESKPGSKDWMDKGKLKKEHTALIKVPKGKAKFTTAITKKEQGGMLTMSPEETEKQKVNDRANELINKTHLKANPDKETSTAFDFLMGKLKPQRPKLKPKEKMKVMSNNDELLGVDKVSLNKKGGKAKPQWLMKAEKKAEKKTK